MKIAMIGLGRMRANMAGRLRPPRTFWLMVPAGAPVDETIRSLLAVAPDLDVPAPAIAISLMERLRRGTPIPSRTVSWP